MNRNEVDFVILKENTPIYFIECKIKNRQINPALRSLQKRYPKAKAVQVALDGNDDYINKDGIHVTTAEKFLANFI